jgi:hypothetical protein
MSAVELEAREDNIAYITLNGPERLKRHGRFADHRCRFEWYRPGVDQAGECVGPAFRANLRTPDAVERSGVVIVEPPTD